MKRVGFALVAACTLMSSAQNADAFVCARALDAQGLENGPALSWASRDLTYALFNAGTADIAGDGENDALRDSFAEWEGITGCDVSGSSDVQFTEQSLSDRDVVGFDFVQSDSNDNLLIFRDEGWPQPGQAGLVIALTTTTFSTPTGEIIDADIEFNSGQFEFAADSASCSGGNGSDLANTATHEIGHYLGLAHTGILGATMQASASPCETTKRDIECDDRDAVVFKYPAGAANRYCGETIDGACGFCAPPEALTSTASVTTGGENNGLEEGCQTLAPLWLGLLFVMRRPRRRMTLAS